nr:hypothetical protein [Chitinophagaceae bacterium]
MFKAPFFLHLLLLLSITLYRMPLAAQCSVTISQNPPGVPCAYPTLSANFIGINNPPTPGNKYFIRDGNPWGSSSYDLALNTVFGNNWSPSTYGNANANAAFLFSPNTQFIYLEGSDGNEASQTAYLAANLPLIESWVNTGGRLLINRAPNAGALITPFGFGGVENIYSNPQYTVYVTPLDPIGTGPYTPAGYGPFLGGSYSHSYISGGNTTSLIAGAGGGVDILCKKIWGNGLVLFGGITAPSFHSPAPNATNLFANIIDYTANSMQGPQINYIWMPGGATTPSITATTPGIYTVTATQAGCTATATILVNFNAAIYPNAIGGPGTIVSNPTGGTPPYQYSLNGGPFVPNNTFSNLCSGVYTLTVKDSYGAGCTADTVLTISNPIISNITDTACASYFFNGNNINLSGIYLDTLVSAFGCDSLIFLNLTINQATTSFITDSACYSYTFNGNNIVNSGLYLDTLLNVVGCDSFINLNLTILTANNGIIQNGPTLSALASGASYQWLDCNSNTLIPGIFTQSYTPPVSGNYAVIVNQNGCIDTSICKTVVVSGIEHFEKNILLKIFPNPASSIISVESEIAFTKITIYDGPFSILKVLHFTATKATEINTRYLAPGIYFIKVDNQPVQKLIIEK